MFGTIYLFFVNSAARLESAALPNILSDKEVYL